MKCLITAGPTFEPLDEVRRLTNFSTGRLGTELAAFLASHGHDVALLRGEQATWTERVNVKLISFSTTADLRDRLRAAASQQIDAVFHAAAVSDFGFGKVWQRTPSGELVPIKSGKISSRLQNLFAELVPTPKIIAELRAWFPTAFLAGWKFEVDGDRQSVIDQGRTQMQESGSNVCVVNGPAYGPGFGVVAADVRHCATKEELFEQLLARLPKRGQ